MDNFKLASILLLLLMIVIQSIIYVHCLDNGGKFDFDFIFK